MHNPVNSNNRMRASAPESGEFYHWLYEGELLDDSLCDRFAAWLEPELTIFVARFAYVGMARSQDQPTA